MNLMEWEVGIPGKQSVRLPFSITALRALDGQLIFEMIHPDTLGGRRVQAHDGLPRRFACLHAHYRALEVLGLTFLRVQIIRPSHPNVRSLRLLKHHSPRGLLLTSR